MNLTFYPESPTNVSKDLTKLTFFYQLKVILAIVSILLFFVLYTLMVIGLGYLVYYAIIYDMGSINKLTILLKLGAIAGSIMLFIFTLKFILNIKNIKPVNRIKLKKEENPELWSFVNQICFETGAPRPKNIYMDPDVNAYVSYSNMWLSLILPVKKELTVGMSLLCCLNLSEFKAVIAHEFGHFAQRSMKIGSYIVSANTIIYDMIFSRDKWDNLLEDWRASDLRFSFAAWAITPIIWVIRQLLSLFYQFLNIMHSALSREMEFNADKTAVLTSGSDAIISALWKLDIGSFKWNNTLSFAQSASTKKIYTNNLFQHNINSINRDSEKITEILNKLPDDDRGGKKFFSNSEASKVHMYASHPPNNLREDNVKKPYVPCKTDNRSPWIIFNNSNSLQEDMTKIIYQLYLNKKEIPSTNASDFENFIHDEISSNNLQNEYSNTFVNRFFNIASKFDLEIETTNVQSSFSAELEKLKTELKGLLEPIIEIEALMSKAQSISEGTSKEKSFDFEGVKYKKENIAEGYNKLNEKREKMFNENFIKWDLRFCAIHLMLAKTAHKEKELLNLYKQHEVISKIYKAIIKVKNSLFSGYNNLRSRDNVTMSEVNTFGEVANDLILSLNKDLKMFDDINFVPLPNIENEKELKEAIVENGLFKKELGPIFENGGFGRMINKIENAMVQCQRIDQKSIGAILAFHKKLQEEVNGVSKEKQEYEANNR